MINWAQITVALTLGLGVGVLILLIGIWIDKSRDRRWQRELEATELEELSEPEEPLHPIAQAALGFRLLSKQLAKRPSVRRRQGDELDGE
jgi:hypothetical protein